MGETIETEYKGFRVEYSEHNDGWAGYNGQKRFTGNSLSELKKKVDAHLKAESKFKNMEAYKIDGWNEPKLIKVTITSVTEDDQVWIKKEKGSREKCRHLSGFYKINPQNEALYNETVAKRKEIDILKREITEIEQGKMEMLDFKQ